MSAPCIEHITVTQPGPQIALVATSTPGPIIAHIHVYDPALGATSPLPPGYELTFDLNHTLATLFLNSNPVATLPLHAVPTPP
jgi:hypothetical protein